MVRMPSHAGTFYPGDKGELRESVESMLEAASLQRIDGRAVSIVVPHAGYIYSGPVAASAYKLIKTIAPKRIILLGPSHYYPLSGPALYGEGSFLTPLGEAPVSKDLTDKIKKRAPFVEISPEAHEREHSLEVQIPFLQVALSGFEIAPLLIPPHRKTGAEEKLARALSEILKEDEGAIVLASSDLSHFHSYREAKRIDENTVRLIEKMSIEELGEGILQGKNELCGDGAVLTAMLSARFFRAEDVKVLSFANSGDTSGDKTRVVGYAAIAFYIKKKETIGEKAKEEILDIVRNTIETYVREKKIPKVLAKSEILNEKKRGVFVTLRKGGELRGCIGCFEPDDALIVFLQKMAVASATQDFRFSPLTEEELKDIKIDVSILSRLKKIDSPDEFIAGEHGIYMKKGAHMSTFLPEVPREQGWDREETLRHLSLKAGLSPDGWKEGAEFFIYTSTMIKEK